MKRCHICWAVLTDAPHYHKGPKGTERDWARLAARVVYEHAG